MGIAPREAPDEMETERRECENAEENGSSLQRLVSMDDDKASSIISDSSTDMDKESLSNSFSPAGRTLRIGLVQLKIVGETLTMLQEYPGQMLEMEVQAAAPERSRVCFFDG